MARSGASARTRASQEPFPRPERRPRLPAPRDSYDEDEEPQLRGPERLRRDLIAIFLGLLGILLGLALYSPGSSGMVGLGMLHFFRFWMGHAVLVAPILFLGAGLTLALDYRRATNPQMVWGVGGMLAVIFGGLHLMTTQHGFVFDTSGARLAAMLGRTHNPDFLAVPDGGCLGALIMSATYPLGTVGSYVALGAIGLASLLLVTELTLRTIMERARERSRSAADRARERTQRLKEKAHERKEAAAARRAERAAEIVEQRPAALPRPSGDRLFLDVEGAPAGRRRRVNTEHPVIPELVEDDDEPEVLQTAGGVPFAESIPVPTFEMEGTEDDGSIGTARGATKRTFRPVSRQADAGSGDYVLPSVDLLDAPSTKPRKVAAETEANIEILENTLGQFRIQAQVVEIADGPSVTRYEIRLGEGVKVRRILDLADNIAMSLSAMSVRVEAPIPGKAAIGIEVPKKQAHLVTMRECVEDAEFQNVGSKIGFVLGKDVAGHVRCGDLAKMPHLLVAGATNSGKSVCLNVLIASLLYRARPDELKLIMIDPKRVELTLFDGIPHLIYPVVKDVKQAAGILRWVLREMDRRYDLFARLMTRNIEGYNLKVAAEPERKLPFIVVIIDELADLMMLQGPEVEQAICRLAQLARATGIHLVVATQRPSVDVITGLIKANVPSRIAFSVSSQIDSRTILDAKGAENLVGRGDMLYKPIDAVKPVRIQGAFLKEAEVERLVNYLKTQGAPEYIAEPLSVDTGSHGIESPEEVEDEMFETAARFIVTGGHASTSMIQRKFKIGYTRAARLVDMMEARGILGPLDGAKPREIRMNRAQLDEMFMGVRNSLFRGDKADRRAAAEAAAADDYDDDEIVEMEIDLPDKDPFVRD